MPTLAPRPKSWNPHDRSGLYCEPGDFYIDPATAGAARGHHAWPRRPCAARQRSSAGDAGDARDHAPALWRARRRQRCKGRLWRAGGARRCLGALVPAGHVLGSAQAVIEYAAAGSSSPAITSADPTRPARLSSRRHCDVFITEATFGLPVFRHPPDSHEIEQAAAFGAALSRALPSRRRLRARQMPARASRCCARPAMTRRSICTAR